MWKVSKSGDDSIFARVDWEDYWKLKVQHG